MVLVHALARWGCNMQRANRRAGFQLIYNTQRMEVLMEQKGPVHKLKIGEVTLTIWQQKTANASSYSVDVFRETKTAEGKWQRETTLSPQEEMVRDELQQYAVRWLLNYQTGGSQTIS